MKLTLASTLDISAGVAGTGKRERNKAENRTAILVAARRVFSSLGYEAATVRDVIGATDLAAGTFYNYFRDKESVLRALLDEKMAEMRQRAQQARRDAKTVDEVVRRTLQLAFAMVVEDREVFELMQRNAGAIRAILDEPSFVAQRDDLRLDLDRALRRSGVRGVDPEYLAAAVSGLAFEVAACAVDRSPGEVDAAAEFCVSLVLAGIDGFARERPAAAASRPSLPMPARARAAKPPATAAGATSRTRRRN